MSAPEPEPVHPHRPSGPPSAEPLQVNSAQTSRRSFSSLEIRNFRLFLAGLLVSGTGAWVQRIAQDWLVLMITGSPTAVGITTACQFLPTLVLGLHGGLLADRLPKRRVLQATQAAMAATSGALATLALVEAVQVWHVYVLALAMGVATAIDNPVRQSFVTEIVGGERLRNAISLVSSTFQLGAIIGPVLSGLLMTTVGAGWAFALNTLTYGAPLLALGLMRKDELQTAYRNAKPHNGIRDGLRYAAVTPTVLWPTVLVGAFGFFTISLPVTLAALVKDDFQSGPGGVGLLNGVVACGSLAGAIITARRTRALRLRTIAGAAWLLAAALVLASVAPSQAALAALLLPVGAANLAFLTSAQSLVQLATPDGLRGRVVGIYMLVFIGSGALGGPAVGLIAEHFGARTALLVSGAVPAFLTAVVAQRLSRRAAVRVGVTSMTLRLPRPALVPRGRSTAH